MDSYAVIGNPVEHSKSPDIHRLFAEQTGQQLVYRKLLGPLDAFAATAQQFFADGGRGLNVTVPFKEEAYALANALTDRARQAFTGFAPSSPSIALLRDGQLLYMVERRDIESRSAEAIADTLTMAFDRFCTPADTVG